MFTFQTTKCIVVAKLFSALVKYLISNTFKKYIYNHLIDYAGLYYLCVSLICIQPTWKNQSYIVESSVCRTT